MKKLALLLLLALPSWAADVHRLTIGAIADMMPSTTAASLGTFTLNEATDAVEWCWQMPEAATVTKLGFTYSARLGTPPTYIISLQGLDASGNPDGTVKGGASPASATFTPPADDTWNGTWRWITLGNSFAVSRGDFVAVVIKHSSGTIDASNYSTFVNTLDKVFLTNKSGQYAINNEAGSRTRDTASPLFGIGTSSEAYGLPVESKSLKTYNSDDTPDEWGFSFTLPTDACTSFKVVGIRWFGTVGGLAANTATLTLYNDTSALQTVTLDSDYWTSYIHRQAVTAYFDETTLSTLTCGTSYYAALLPGDTTTNSRVLVLTSDSSTELSAYPGGADWHVVSRTDAGAWSEDTASRLVASIIVEDITPPAAGGEHSYVTVQ